MDEYVIRAEEKEKEGDVIGAEQLRRFVKGVARGEKE